MSSQLAAPPAVMDMQAEVDDAPSAWLGSLRDSLSQLEETLTLYTSLLACRERGELPTVLLQVMLPGEETNPTLHGTVLPWLAMLESERLLWTPLLRIVRMRIAKLTLDIGDLNKFASIP